MKNFITYGIVFFTIAMTTVGVTLFFLHEDAKITAKNDGYDLVVKEAENGWLYEIHYNDQPIIKQESIPAVSGNRPFATKEDAKKIGTLVLHKIQKGIMPPTVSIADVSLNNIMITPL